MTPRPVLRPVLGLLLLLGVLAAPACKSLLGIYDGPIPASEPLREEIVVVRTLYLKPGGGVSSFHVDRVRFLDAKKPHDINRVVDVRPGDAAAGLDALQVKVGDRLRISTRFLWVGEASGLGDEIPDWPYGKYFEYPVGVHSLTAVERVSP